ncbi:hypothetical protein EsH8_IV_001273 [Colletotrichum jinshuiense]
MRFHECALALLVVAEGVLAVPRPKAEALPLTLIPRESKGFAKRNKPSARQMAANGRSCGNITKQGVCDNGRCGVFVAPTGFDVIPGAESQCVGADLP